ncbi:metallo-beta-lactamase/rhodanese-like domain-containing protein [Flammeovirgaceae bacterium 311]|nr:metallo-beta-lactamase/rhodanese-like domain-containing protein [Flammeovirgaceae bacterium 311]
MLKIKQFYDEGLAHASYAVVSDGKMAVIDPGRNPQPYIDYASEHGAQIYAVIETHPHADFVSAHLELHKKTGATVYVSRKAEAAYPHTGFDDGDTISLGKIVLKAYNTPGHSPDSITVLLIDEDGRQHSVFTGDTLFVGDVGRPDLREKEDDQRTMREYLAKQMYQSTRDIIMQLERDVLVYPAHGAGSLCGKNISTELTSTIGKELEQNYALQQMSEKEFIETLLEDQPFIPRYFSRGVELNKQGAPDYEESISKVPRLGSEDQLEPGVLIVDTRDQLKFKNRHIKGAINIMDGSKFETWLGSIVGPEEPFYLIAEDAEKLERLIGKAAKIGYESNIRGALANQAPGEEHDLFLILEHFKAAPQNYTVVDVRNEGEVRQGKVFEHAIPIPLHQLRERKGEVPTDKPVVVHCGAGYRSAAGFSILDKELEGTRVYDLGEAIKDYL